MGKVPQTYEEAYARLEEILEVMNGENVSLDSALALYEEADRLIGVCQNRLTLAEQKIEILMKNRDGTLAESAEGRPLAETFAPQRQSALQT